MREIKNWNLAYKMVGDKEETIIKINKPLQIINGVMIYEDSTELGVCTVGINLIEIKMFSCTGYYEEKQ